ncbi:MAG: dienelactone hydrolase family protein [Pseudomonadota bacterium]
MTMANKEVTYQCEGQTLTGYFSWDDTIDNVRPGVILIHEWWGLNDYIRMRADQIAELGYCALAIDMYGDGQTAENPEQAGELMQSVTDNMSIGTKRLQAGYQTLVSDPLTDAEKTAAIGYCFGGAMALHMARTGIPLRSVATFHAALGSFHQASPGEITAEILVCHGNADAMVTQDHVREFEQEMTELGVTYDIQRYDHVSHGFTNPEADANREKFSVPLAYNQAADASSWIAMQNLLARTLT